MRPWQLTEHPLCVQNEINNWFYKILIINYSLYSAKYILVFYCGSLLLQIPFGIRGHCPEVINKFQGDLREILLYACSFCIFLIFFFTSNFEQDRIT